jgi:hypothetical protein
MLMERFRGSFIAKLRDGVQLRFYIPKECAQVKGIWAGKKVELRLLHKMKKRWAEFAIMKANAIKEHSSLFCYIPISVKKENNLKIGDEIGVEIIG